MFRRVVIPIALIVVMGMTASCSMISSWFGSDDPAKPTSVSVFDVAIGDCFTAPKDVAAELSNLSKVPCSVDHQQELYATVDYTPPSTTTAAAQPGDSYPGDAVLDTYAQGACAEAFTGYIGIAYPDSGLWMTYLLPSARSWQSGEDRQILCFVTTTGSPLTKSVKGSKL